LASSSGLHAQSRPVLLVAMPPTGVRPEIDPGTMAAYSQNILGSKMGSARIQIDMKNLIALYEQGRLKLDELVTKTYPLEEINEAIAAVKRGDALRNVIVF
ncbi:MAG: zinc-binding dehydrogenase, partial [Acidimicrobiaceae bacterium]